MKKSLLIPLLLALVPAIVIIMLLPPVFEKYEIEEQTTNFKEKKNAYIRYHDLEGGDDGMELIKAINTDIGNAAIMVLKEDGELIRQYNYTGRFPVRNNPRFWISDYNHDDIFELYFFTHRKDSAFLQILSINNHEAPLLQREIFLDIISITKQQVYDFGAGCNDFTDVNGDNNREVLINLRGYYSEVPRKVFTYDIANNTLQRSGNFSAKPGIRLLSSKPFARYLVSALSSANIENPNPYLGSDYHDQMFLLDDHLNVIKGPVVYGEYRSYGHVKLLSEQQKILTVFAPHELTNGHINLELQHFDYNLTLLKKKKYFLPDKANNFFSISNKDYIACFTKDTLTTFSANSLDLSKKKELPFNNFSKRIFTNIDTDVADELVALGFFELAVFDDNFTLLSKIPVDYKTPGNSSIVLVQNNERLKNHFLLQDEDKYSLIKIKENEWYYFQIPLYFSIYLLSFGFTLLITYLTRLRTYKFNRMRNEILNLQLQSARNQASPHFTYNLLNTISSAILNEEKEKAQSMVSSMGQLMRSSLKDSENVERSIKNELDFVENYFLLEQQRFNEKLNYQIEIEEGVDTSVPVPKMLLQIFVENAIKHGINPLNSRTGMVRILLKNRQNTIQVSIEDNGVGRQLAQKNGNNSTKSGLKIADKIIKLHKKLNDFDIKYQIIDKYDENNNPNGTKVIIDISNK